MESRGHRYGRQPRLRVGPLFLLCPPPTPSRAGVVRTRGATRPDCCSPATFSTHSRQSKEGDGEHGKTRRDGLSNPRLRHLVSIPDGGHGNLWKKKEKKPQEGEDETSGRSSVLTMLSAKNTHCSQRRFGRREESLIPSLFPSLLMCQILTVITSVILVTVPWKEGERWKELESN